MKTLLSIFLLKFQEFATGIFLRNFEIALAQLVVTRPGNIYIWSLLQEKSKKHPTLHIALKIWKQHLEMIVSNYWSKKSKKIIRDCMLLHNFLPSYNFSFINPLLKLKMKTTYYFSALSSPKNPWISTRIPKCSMPSVEVPLNASTDQAKLILLHINLITIFTFLCE